MLYLFYKNLTKKPLIRGKLSVPNGPILKWGVNGTKRLPYELTSPVFPPIGKRWFLKVQRSERVGLRLPRTLFST